MNRRQSGFTLLELLLVVAIIAIIASIALMNYLGALQKAKEKKTMTDIRTIASAWEARATETNSFTAAGMTFPETTLTWEQMNAALSPTYSRNIPRFDGWGREFDFGVGGPKDYAIRSPGRDGKFDSDYTAGATNNPDCDIVYANGSFVVYPDSMVAQSQSQAP